MSKPIDFGPLLAKFPPKHGERTAKVIAAHAITALPDTIGGTTDWGKQASLPVGKPNSTVNDPIPVRGVTQKNKKKEGRR